jgi:uncharacterized protein (TIGR02588 family)
MDNSKTAQAHVLRTGGRLHPADPASPWEWAVAALGLLLIVGVIGYMAYYAVTAQPGPPRIIAVRESIEPNGEGYLVTVRIANHGTSTAAALQIEGKLLEAGRTVETSEATIDYVPRRSERKAGLMFSRDPARYRLVIRPMGYTEP